MFTSFSSLLGGFLRNIINGAYKKQITEIIINIAWNPKDVTIYPLNAGP